jgi:nucleoside-diphosphate-sugar epimerase
MVRKKVLITGGSGYLGSRLCLYLANQGYAVTALCHSKPLNNEVWTAKMDSVVFGDIRDEKFVNELAEINFQIVIHLVSLDHHDSNGVPSFVSSVNIIPVWSLLDIFSKKGLEKFIYFSTIQVYGPVQGEKVVEQHHLNTQNAYGLTHHIGEVICDYYNRNSSVECHIARLSNSYGAPIFEENNCWWLVINDLCRMAYLNHEIVLQSDGSPLRDFIHGWDVCSAVQCIIETKSLHSCYNISSGITLSIMDIALKVQEVYVQRFGKELRITAAVGVNRPPSPYQMDNSLIRSIGFETKWSLKDGINDLFDFLEGKKV